jgi:glutamine cyclotransferase
MDVSNTVKEEKHVSQFVRVREMVHDPTAFTQGLVVHDGILVSRYCELIYFHQSINIYITTIAA